MESGVAFFIRILITEDIQSRIVMAKARGEKLSIPANAEEIARSYPGSALSDDDLRDRLLAEATRAGVGIELTREPSEAH